MIDLNQLKTDFEQALSQIDQTKNFATKAIYRKKSQC